MASSESITTLQHESHDLGFSLERQAVELLAGFTTEFHDQLEKDPLSVYSPHYYRNQVKEDTRGSYFADTFADDTDRLITLAGRRFVDNRIWQKCNQLLEKMKQSETSPEAKLHHLLLIFHLVDHISEMGKAKEIVASKKKLEKSLDQRELERAYQQVAENFADKSVKGKIFNKLKKKVRSILRGTAITVVNTSVITAGTAHALHIRDVEDAKNIFKTAFKPMAFETAELLFPNDLATRGYLIEVIDRVFDQGQEVDLDEVVSILTEKDGKKRAERASAVMADWEYQAYFDDEFAKLEATYFSQSDATGPPPEVISAWGFMDVLQADAEEVIVSRRFLEPLIGRGISSDLETIHPNYLEEFGPIFEENAEFVLYNLARQVVLQQINQRGIEGEVLSDQYQNFFDQLSDQEEAQLIEDIKNDWRIAVFGGSTAELKYLLSEVVGYYRISKGVYFDDGGDLTNLVDLIRISHGDDFLVSPESDLVAIHNFVTAREDRWQTFNIDVVKTLLGLVLAHESSGTADVNVENYLLLIDATKDWDIDLNQLSVLLAMFRSIEYRGDFDFETMAPWLEEFDSPLVAANFLNEVILVTPMSPDDENPTATVYENWVFLKPYILRFQQHTFSSAAPFLRYVLQMRSFYDEEEFEQQMETTLSRFDDMTPQGILNFSSIYDYYLNATFFPIASEHFQPISREEAEITAQQLLDLIEVEENLGQVSDWYWQPLLSAGVDHTHYNESFWQRMADIVDLMNVLSQTSEFGTVGADKSLSVTVALLYEGLSLTEIIEMFEAEDPAVLSVVFQFMPHQINDSALATYELVLELMKDNPRLVHHPFVKEIIRILSIRANNFNTFNPTGLLEGIGIQLDLFDRFVEKYPDADRNLLKNIIFRELGYNFSLADHLVNLFPLEFEAVVEEDVVITAFAKADLSSTVQATDRSFAPSKEGSTIRVPLLFLNADDRAYVFSEINDSEPISLLDMDHEVESGENYYDLYTRYGTRHLLTIDKNGFAQVVTFADLGSNPQEVTDAIHQFSFVATVNPLFYQDEYIYDSPNLSEEEIEDTRRYLDTRLRAMSRFITIVTDQGNVYFAFVRSNGSDEGVLDAVTQGLAARGEVVTAALVPDTFRSTVTSGEISAATAMEETTISVQFGLEQMEQD